MYILENLTVSQCQTFWGSPNIGFEWNGGVKMLVKHFHPMVEDYFRGLFKGNGVRTAPAIVAKINDVLGHMHSCKRAAVLADPVLVSHANSTARRNHFVNVTVLHHPLSTVE